MGKADGFFQIDYSQNPFQRIQALWSYINSSEDYGDFASEGLKHVRPISATREEGTQKAKVEYELTVSKSLCNRVGNLHGGAACTLLDFLTSTPLNLIAKPGYLESGHVSRTITMSYLRPVPAGTTVRVECELVAAGKNTANIYGVIKMLDGRICVTCIHDKAILSKEPKSKL